MDHNHNDSDDDPNPRPQKRVRLTNPVTPPTSSPLSTPPHSPAPNPAPTLRPLPPQSLLLSLPSLLLHPPTHKNHPRSLHLSLLALRKCLSFTNLTPEEECRAWTALGEVGMRIIGGGFCDGEDGWARGVEGEVERAIGKAMLIAQKHPSLRLYHPHLTLLSAHLSLWQHNFKYSRSLLRRLISSPSSNTPATTYSAHLSLISQLSCTPTSSSSPSPSSSSLAQTLQAIQSLLTLSQTNSHPQITLLSHVLRLRVLIRHTRWDDARDALGVCERGLGVSYSPSLSSSTWSDNTSSRKPTTPSPLKRSSLSTPTRGDNNASPRKPTSPLKRQREEETYIAYTNPLESSLAQQVLILGIVLYTHLGRAAEAEERMRHLHALFDGGFAGEGQGEGDGGYVEVDMGEGQGPPLLLIMPHPRTMMLLTYLVSSTSSRDPVGRTPKRKKFALGGLATYTQEPSTQSIALPPWTSTAELYAVEQTAERIKADLLSEVVGVSIMRSEFDVAESSLNTLIAHTRTTNLFEAYSALITLHHAHLAHALGRTGRALECYRVAAFLARGAATLPAGGGEGEGARDGGEEVVVAGEFVRVCARAGEVALKIGLARAEGGIDEETKEMGKAVALECRGVGVDTTLQAIGRIIEACLSDEILKSKQNLKQSLSLTSLSQDNHLRALLLALISAYYFHTEIEHALGMLGTCEQLAAGLGAGAGGGKRGGGKENQGRDGMGGKGGGGDAVGNAPLRLWVGERFLGMSFFFLIFSPPISRPAPHPVPFPSSFFTPITSGSIRSNKITDTRILITNHKTL
ncbi:hypothetical protein PILCRDRAFT_469683 [Piloderma croceum F 1598]|uniref:Anaphase-promoting complex subunit 5 n=1 Tax=Piloderma croceum (strain F 1598) TaxID=765440 RepID=A0A0C3FR22_PILCF|nr:hypothetical protein PILCRDRAFT_469683 [Piloderma croceum F 1598]